MSDRPESNPHSASPLNAQDMSPSVELSAADVDAEPEFYRDSGLIPLAAFTVMPAYCFTVAAVSGVVYSYLMWAIPLIYAHAFITVFAGLGLGRFVIWAVVKWKVRSTAYALLFAVATSGVAYYSAWAADLLARFGLESVGGNPLWAWYPPVLLDYIAEFYREGFWSTTEGKPVKEMRLMLHWLVEAAVLFGYPIHEVWKSRKSRAFCEHCDRWTEAKVGVAKYYPGREVELAERIAARDFAALAERLGIPDHLDDFLRLNVHTCATCRITRHVTIEHVVVVPRNNGSQKITITTVVDRLEVDEATLMEIVSLTPPDRDD